MSLPNYLSHGNKKTVNATANNADGVTVELKVPTVQHAEYELALLDVLKHGDERGDRTGTGTLSMFGLRMEFDLQKGFPLITSKRVYWKGVAEELLWFLRGDTNAKSLQDVGVHIWDEWAHPETGELGPVYGKQWRNWEANELRRHGMGTVFNERTIDQVQDAINQIKGDPTSRRIIVSAWNPKDIPDMALPPCHLLFQFYVTGDGHLDIQMYQRSADMFLGVPFNIASYALLCHIVAAETGLKPGRLIHVIGDAHIYTNHIGQVVEQLSREVREFPTLTVNSEGARLDVGDYEFGDFVLEGYDPHPAIKGAVAV